MSLILDALHRSDQERSNQGTVPGIQTLHGESGISGSPIRTMLPGLVVLLLLALVAWLVFSRWPTEDARPIDTVAPAPAPAGDVGAPASGAAGLRAEPKQGAGAAAAVRRPQTTARADASVPAPGPQVSPVAEPTSTAAVAELYQRSAVTEAPAPAPVAVEKVEESLPVDAMVAAARQELAAPPRDEDPTPLVQDLPQRTKDEIPSLFFSKHSWSSSNAEKQVTLNGEVHREGDMVVPGVRLIEIREESILLDFQGTRFRLRALNSWVNL